MSIHFFYISFLFKSFIFSLFLFLSTGGHQRRLFEALRVVIRAGGRPQ